MILLIVNDTFENWFDNYVNIFDIVFNINYIKHLNIFFINRFN